MGMLTPEQCTELKEAGLDFYNHNLDTSPEYYSEIITTRTYDDRLQTLQNVYEAGLNTCCGGILGMGETVADRLKLLQQIANLPSHPRSVPINQLIATPGTPFENQPPVDSFEFVRIIACARIMMPLSRIRLSGNRLSMSDETQALCFLAGANSIFVGDKLLTRQNCSPDHDQELLSKLGFSCCAFQTEPQPALG
jgi:biotin synthase